MFYPSTKLAFATLHIFKRRVPSIPSTHHHLQSTILKLSSDESPSETKDWFVDGREVARQLKMELGITSKDDSDTTTDDTEIQDDEVSSKFKVSNDVLESGRAAARELLKDMMTTDDNDDIIQSKEDKVVASKQIDIKEEKDYFNVSSRKSHCYTICMVPPPSAMQAWEELTAIRKQCKDPGFYRWPPHANILYPFIEPKYDEKSEESKDDQLTTFRNEMSIQLSKAAERCEPFDVTIDAFGTFGGTQRGVMWAYPRSEYIQSTTTNNGKELEPLHHLHRQLEEQFPMCKDQRKGGEFNPHMTISHYANNDTALEAKEEIESNWKPLSFHVPEIYLLERKGDDGQFKIAAAIPLGKGSKTVYHEQALPFPAMPKVEEDWVFNERMEMKNRRKRGNKRRKRRSKRSNVDTSSEGEEERCT